MNLIWDFQSVPIIHFWIRVCMSYRSSYIFYITNVFGFATGIFQWIYAESSPNVTSRSYVDKITHATKKLLSGLCILYNYYRTWKHSNRYNGRCRKIKPNKVRCRDSGDTFPTFDKRYKKSTASEQGRCRFMERFTKEMRQQNMAGLSWTVNDFTPCLRRPITTNVSGLGIRFL